MTCSREDIYEHEKEWFETTRKVRACDHTGPVFADKAYLSVADCPCGAVHDRDLNAAINLRTLGFRETLGAQDAVLRGSDPESSRMLVDRRTSGLVHQTKSAG